MFKTKKRVISLILAALMVLSSVSVFAFAEGEAPAFADSYQAEYEALYGKDAVIENTALLVDNSITTDEQAAESFTRTWDGIEFSFKYSENAFTTIESAYASANENDTIDIIVLGIASSTSASLSISKPSRVFSPAWDMVPMNEMGDSFNAIASNGADWTVNDAYSDNAIEVKNLYYTNALTSGTAEVYGFAVNNVIGWGGAYGAFRTPDVNSPVTMKFINGIYKAPTNAMFFYQYGSGSDNTDTAVVKNVYMNGAKNLEYSSQSRPHMPANVVLDGLYYDITNMTNNNYFQCIATTSSVTIQNSYFKGTNTSYRFSISHNNNKYPAAGTRVVTLNNNVFKHSASGGMFYMELHDTNKLYVTNNYMDKTADGGAYVIDTANIATIGSRLTGSQERELVFSGNKILGYSKSFPTTFTYEFTPVNNFVTSSTGDAATTAVGVALSAPVGGAGAYYYDYDMTKWSGAIPLVDGDTQINGVSATVDNENSTITVSDVGEINASDFVENNTSYSTKIDTELGERKSTLVKPTVTIENTATNQTTGAINTELAGNYKVTVAYEGIDSKTYTLNVGTLTAPAFDDETEGYEQHDNGPTKDAILIDSNLSGEAGGNVVIKSWENELYSFIVGTNAFESFAAAKTAGKITSGCDIIVLDLNGGNIEIDVAADIYAPNWNTKPFVVGDDAAETAFDNGTWQATKSDAADWTVNETYAASAVNVADICIDADIDGSVGIHGFTVKSHILLGGKSPRTSDTYTTNVTISNTVVDSQDLNAQGLFNEAGTAAYNNTDTLTFKNVYIKSLAGTNSRMFGDTRPLPAHMEFDGLWINLDTVNASYTSNGNTVDQIKSAALDSSITFKNSNIRKNSSISGHYWQFYQVIPSANLVARKLTFENSILLNSRGTAYGGIGLIMNSYSDVKLDSNFIMDTTAFTALFQNAASVARFTSVNMTITNNLLLGYSEPNLGAYSASVITAVVHDNFIVKANKTTLDAYKAVVGSTAKNSALTLEDGTPDRYYYDYAMTKSNVSLTLETGKFGDIDVAVDGTNISITGTSGTITKEQIIANAMTDAPDDSAEPKVTITDINKNPVDDNITLTQTPTLYNIEVEFEGYDSIEYMLDVNDFKSTVSAFSAKQDTEDTVIKNTAVLVDTTIAGGEETVYREWDGTWYSFEVDSNAFSTYTAAESVVDAGGQIIVTGWNNSAITVTKAVSVYTPNWNTMPFTRDAQDGEWKAVNSDGKDWTENTENWSDVKMGAVTINNAVTGEVAFYGFEFTNGIALNAKRANNATKATYKFVNNKYNGTNATMFHLDYGSVNNSDELYVKNLYVKNSKNIMPYEHFVPNVTFDGFYFNVGNLQKGHNFKFSASDSTFTIKNSYLYGTTSYNFQPSVNGINTVNSRVVAYENNVLKSKQSRGSLYMEPYDATVVTITGNYIDKSADTTNPVLDSQVAYGSRVNGCEVTFENNKVVGYTEGKGVASAITNTFTPANNFVTTATGEAAKTAVGIEFSDNNGNAGAYWFDYGMTKSSAALTLDSVVMGDATSVTVDGTNVAVTGTSGTITKEQIIANAAADKPVGSVNADTVTIKDVISGEDVTEIDLTQKLLLNVTVEFDGYASEEYLFNVNNYNVTAFVNKSNDDETILNTAVLVDTDLTDAEDGDTVYKKWDDTVYSFEYGTNAFNSLSAALEHVNAGNPQVIVTGWDGSKLSVTTSVSIYTPNWDTVPMLEMADGFNALTSNGADWNENGEWKSGFIANGFETTVTNIDVGVYGFEYTAVILPKHQSTSGTITIKNSIFESETADVIAPYITKDNTATLNVVNMYVKDAVNLFTYNQMPAHVTFDGLYFDVTKINRNNYAQTYAAGASSITFKDSYIYGTADAAKSWRLIASHANQQNLASGTRVATYHNNTLKFKQAYGMLYTESHDTTSMVVTNNYMDKNVDGGEYLIYSGVTIGSRLTGGQETSLTFENNKIIGFANSFSPAITTDFTPANNYVYGTLGDGEDSYEGKTGYALAGPTGKIGDYYLDYDMTIKYSDIAVKGFTVNEQDAGDVFASDFAVIEAYRAGDDALNNVTVALANGAEGRYFYDEACAEEIAVENRTKAELKKLGNTPTVYYKVTKEGYTRVYTVVVVLEQPVDYAGIIDGITGDTVVYTPWKGVTILPDNTYYSTFKGTVYKFTINGSTVYTNNTTAPSADFAGKNVILPAGEFGNINVAYGANFYGSNYGVNPNDKSTASAANNFDWEFNEAWDQVNSTKVNVIAFNENNNVEQELKFNGITMQGTYQDTVRTTAAAQLDATFENIVVDSTTTLLFNANSGRAGRAMYGWNLNSTSPEITAPPTETWATDYKDSVEFKDVRIVNVGAKFHVVNETILPYTTFDGLYFDADDIDANIYTDIGVIKNGPYVGETVLNIINSNFRGNKLYDGKTPRPFIFISGIHSNDKVIAQNEYTVNISNNIMYDVAADGSQIVAFNGLEGRHATNFAFNNNVVIETNSAKANNLFTAPTGDSPVVENLEINGNKFVGFAKSKLNDSVLAATTSNVYADTFATTETDAHTRPSDDIGYEVSAGTDYYVNFGSDTVAQVKNSELTIASVSTSNAAIVDRVKFVGGIISFKLAEGADPANAFVATYKTPGKATGTFNNDYTLYTVTSDYSPTVSRSYTVKYYSGEGEPFVTTTNDLGGDIKNTAVLLSNNDEIANVASEGECSAEWNGELYSFTKGDNAFDNYAEAEAAAVAKNAENPQIIVTEWVDGTAFNITKAVSIYSPNWNTKPFIVDNNADSDAAFDNGTWSAAKANGAEWVERDTAGGWYEGLEVPGVTISNAIIGEVALYGFEFTKMVGLSAKRANNAAASTYTFKNCKFESGEEFVFNFDYGSVNNTDTLNVTNFLIRGLTNRMHKYADWYAPANVTFDGLYYNVTNVTTNEWLKTSCVDSSVTIKNSYIFGETSSVTLKPSINSKSAKGGVDYSNITRTVTYDNNVLLCSIASNQLAIEPNHTSEFIVTNNYMDKSANPSTSKLIASNVPIGHDIGGGTLTFEGNKVISYSVNTGISTALTTQFTPKDNFITLMDANDQYVTQSIGQPLNDRNGNAGRYWVDYDMTMSSTALRLENDDLFTIDSTEVDDVVRVAKDATVTTGIILEHAYADAPAGSVRPNVTVTDSSGQEVVTLDTSSDTYYTVKLSFANESFYYYDANGEAVETEVSNEYKLFVGDYTETDPAKDEKELGPVVLISDNNEYNIVWRTKEASQGTVTISGVSEPYKDEKNGVVRAADYIHTVRVPYSELDGKTYSVSGIDGEFNFNGASNSTDNIEFATFSDTHFKPDDASKKSAMLDFVEERMSTLHANADVIVLNGDITDQLANKAEYYGLFEFMYAASSGGTKPIIYTVGNHEKRGFYAKEIEKYLTHSTGEMYAHIDYGPTSIILLDSGEDKGDSAVNYGGVNNFAQYFTEQYNWLQSIGGYNEQKQYTFVINHGPAAVCTGNELQATYCDTLYNFGTDLALGGHIHTSYGLNENYGSIKYPVAIAGSHGDGNTNFSSSIVTCSGGEYDVTWYYTGNYSPNSIMYNTFTGTKITGTTGTIEPVAPEEQEQQAAAAVNAASINTAAGISTAEIKSDVADTAIITDPVVFDSGEYYSVVWQTTAGTKVAGYIEVDNKLWLAAHSGKLRTETTHSVRIPKAELAGKTYTVMNRVVGNYNSYGYYNASGDIKGLDYGAWVIGEPITMAPLKDSSSPNFRALAVANKTGGAADAETVLTKYNAKYSTNPDLLVMLGNMTSGLTSEERFGTDILGYAAKVTGGTYPVVFNRGTNEMAEGFGAEVSRFIRNFTTEGAIGGFDTNEQYGDKYSFVAVDTKDQTTRQTTWLGNLGSIDTKYSLAFANATPSSLGAYGANLVVTAGDSASAPDFEEVVAGQGVSNASVGNSTGLVITCGEDMVKVKSLDDDLTENIYVTSYDEFSSYDDTDKVIKNDAVLIDTSIVNADNGDIINREWEGTTYSFTYGTNLFNNLEDALDTEATQVIITKWDGSIVTIDRAVEIYTPNWDTVPMNEMGDANWSATASNGADWTANEDFDDSFVANGLTIADTVTGTVTVRGFKFTAQLDLNGSARNAQSGTLTVNLVNNRFEANVRVFDAVASNYDNANTLNVEHFQIVGAVKRLFQDEKVFANINFDGLYYNLTGTSENSYIKTSAKVSSYTYQNCNFQGTTTANFRVSIANNGSTIADATRPITLNNNVFNYMANDGVMFLEPLTTKTLTITNNYINKANDANALLQYNNSSYHVGSLLTDKTGVVITVTDNKIVGLTKGFTNHEANDCIIEDNYVTAVAPVVDEAATDYTNIKGIKLKDKNGNGGDYYLDYAMTMKAYDNITVNVSWGAMTFEYSESDWNVEEGKYDSQEWTATKVDENDSNFVTVDNVNLTPVEAEVTFEKDAAFESDEMAGSIVKIVDEQPVASVVNAVDGKPLGQPEGEGESVTVYLVLTGKVADAKDRLATSTKLGTLTVTIDA